MHTSHTQCHSDRGPHQPSFGYWRLTFLTSSALLVSCSRGKNTHDPDHPTITRTRQNPTTDNTGDPPPIGILSDRPRCFFLAIYPLRFLPRTNLRTRYLTSITPQPALVHLFSPFPKHYFPPIHTHCSLPVPPSPRQTDFCAQIFGSQPRMRHAD